MEWDSKLCFRLIEEYRLNEVLWDPKNPMYYSKRAKHEAWCSISKNLNKDIEEVKKKLLSLQGSFRRERAKTKNSAGRGKGANKIYKSKWFAYEAMQFLADRDYPRNMISSENPYSNIEEPSTDLPRFSSDDSQLNNSVLPSENQLNSVDIPTTISPGTAQSQTKTANLQPDRDNDFIRPVQHQKSKQKGVMESGPETDEAFTILRKSASDISQNSSDECTTYGLYVGNKIRNYQPKTRSLVQHYINNVLFKADMGKFDFNGARSSSSLRNLGTHCVCAISSNSPPSPSSASSSIDPSDGCGESDLT